MTEIKDLSKCIDLNNWTYYFKNKHASPINLITVRGQFHLYRDIFNGNIELVKAGKDQKQFKFDLNEKIKEILKKIGR